MNINSNPLRGMKCIPLLFSLTFPKNHPSTGQRTMFDKNIRGGTKITTLRFKYSIWQPLIQQVQEGTAYLSCRLIWNGSPRDSSIHEFLRLTAEDGVGIERLVDYPNHAQVSPHADPNYRQLISLDKLAENDGLTTKEFTDWFPSWGQVPGERALIHLTPFRYMEGARKTSLCQIQ